MKAIIAIALVVVGGLAIAGLFVNGHETTLDTEEVQITKTLLSGGTVPFTQMPLHLKHGFVDEATATRIAKRTVHSTDEIFQLYRELGFVHHPTTLPATTPSN